MRSRKRNRMPQRHATRDVSALRVRILLRKMREGTLHFFCSAEKCRFSADLGSQIGHRAGIWTGSILTDFREIGQNPQKDVQSRTFFRKSAIGRLFGPGYPAWRP